MPNPERVLIEYLMSLQDGDILTKYDTAALQGCARRLAKVSMLAHSAPPSDISGES